MNQVKYYISRDCIYTRFSIWAHNYESGRCYNLLSNITIPSKFGWNSLDRNPNFKQITEAELRIISDNRQIDWKW